MSSSQLTFILFRGVGIPPTSHDIPMISPITNMLLTGMMARGIIPLSLKSRDAPPILTLAPVVQLPLLKYECWNGSFLLTPPKTDRFEHGW